MMLRKNEKWNIFHSLNEKDELTPHSNNNSFYLEISYLLTCSFIFVTNKLYLHFQGLKLT